MDSNIIAAILGACAGVASGLIASWVAIQKLRKEAVLNFNAELASKQMSASEELWKTLSCTSKSPGKDRVIVFENDTHLVDALVSQSLVDNLNKVFSSSEGLYFSRNVRQRLFALRNFVEEEFVALEDRGEDKKISMKKIKSFRNRVVELRVAIRDEIGVRDLQVSQQYADESEA